MSEDLGSNSKSFKNIQIEYVDESQNTIPSVKTNRAMILSLPLIPGNLGGKIKTEPILVKEVRDSETFEFDLQSVLMNVEKLSTIFVRDEYTKDVQIQPSDVLMSRVGTFAQDKVSQKKYGGGFRDIATRDTLVLAYFSGPCDVSGIAYSKQGTFDFTVHITIRGFHWLRVNELAESQFLVTSHEPISGVNFLVIDKDVNKP